VNPVQPEFDFGGVSAETPLLLTIVQAAHLLGVGRSKIYELIGRGDLEVVYIGRSVRVPFDVVTEFVRRLRSR
jgi:excisionase family DNA binding protein